MITRHGLVVPDGPELKKELTVRPIENALGLRAPSFKVWRGTTTGTLIVPRYYGLERFGPPTRDTRKYPARAESLRFVGTLRSDTRQTEAFEAGVRAFAETGGGVLSLPPGYGKTCMALAFSAHLKVRTMIVVHKEFLANQWRDRIQAFCPGATIGRIQGETYDVEKDFVIAMIQTMCQREFPKDAFDSIGFLVVDEAHHIGAPAFSQFMFKVCPRWTLGLTATPERKDGLTRLLYWFLGPEFFRVERKDQKTTRVEVIRWLDPSGTFSEPPPVTRFGKLNMAGMITVITELEARNEMLFRRIHELVKEKRRVLVLSDRRDHCLFFHEKLGSKLSGLYIGGMKEDDLAISAQKSVVIATFQLAQEGLDIPVLDTVILATPKSDIKQSIGRIMRETPGKVNAPLIIDVVDQWSVCLPMFRKRSVVYRESGFETETHRDTSESPKVFGAGSCQIQA
jgi:superfamily II DNA or RNA helicase